MLVVEDFFFLFQSAFSIKSPKTVLLLFAMKIKIECLADKTLIFPLEQSGRGERRRERSGEGRALTMAGLDGLNLGLRH